MVGLLDLPSELLFNIIDFVLSPTVLPKDGTRHRVGVKTQPRDVYCVPSLDYLNKWGAISLLLVNRKMYAETREYLSKASRSFHVDIAVVSDHWFWPTQRVVPARKLDGVIERLDIKIIPCCTAEERHLQTNWDHNGVYPVDFSTYRRLLVVELIAPLIRFLHGENVKNHRSEVFRGLETWVDPLLGAKLHDGRNLPIRRIDTVTISIDTSRYGNGNDILSLTEVPFRKIVGLAHLDFEQLYPVDLAKSETYLRELSSCIDEWPSWNYGTEGVVKKIGKIQFYLNGKMSKELDSKRIMVVEE
jgi:hypothetical protein